jgi:hypothetical protein
MSKELIPGSNKVAKKIGKFIHRGKRTVFQTLLPHDAKPDFDHVQPRAMFRSKVNYDTFIFTLEPFLSLLFGYQLFFGISDCA